MSGAERLMEACAWCMRPAFAVVGSTDGRASSCCAINASPSRSKLPPRLSPPSRLRPFPVRSGRTLGFRGQSVSLAMPRRLPCLASRLPFLADRRLLPTRSDSRRSNSTSESVSWFVASSVRISLPTGSSCSFFHSVLLPWHSILVLLLLPLSAASLGGTSCRVFG